MLSLAVCAAQHRDACAGAGRQTARNWPAKRVDRVRAPAAAARRPTASRAGIAGRRAPLLDLGQPVVQRLDQQPAPARVVEQVVLQVGIALHHPDVAQHLVQHARRAAGAALAAQRVQHLPGALAEQADHDLAIGERGVVVGNLAQARRGARPPSAAAAMRVSGSGAFMDGRSVRRRAAARGARHRTAAQQNGLRHPCPPRRGGYSRLPGRGPSAR